MVGELARSRRTSRENVAAGPDEARVERVLLLGHRVRRAVAVSPGHGRADEHVEVARREQLSRHRHVARSCGARPRRAAATPVTTSDDQRRPRLSPRDPVDPDHPVSSCGPRRGSGRAMCPARPRASAPRSSRPGRSCACPRSRPGICQRWPCTWKVWWSSPIASTSHCTSSPTFARKTGVLPTNARPLIVLKSSVLREEDDELAVGRLLVSPEDRDRAVHPARDRVGHRRRVVVVRPDARRVRRRPRAVGEGAAGLDVRRPPGEAGDVRPVRPERVPHAVEVHRVRALELVVQVLEVDEDRVADARPDQRPGDAVVVGRDPGSFRSGFAQSRV